MVLCFALSLALVMGLCAVPVSQAEAATTTTKTTTTTKKTTTKKKYTKETRGLWIAFCDFEDMGLYNKSKKTFTKNISKALDKAKKNGVNTIYWHARAFDDATWKSKTFKASEYLSKRASSKKTAYKTYSYDPLKIVIQQCQKRGMKVEAWLNPYRITYNNFLDPASSRSTDRINRAVNELKKYDLDGIHMDDYFYHSAGKYTTPTKATRYKIKVKGKKRYRNGIRARSKRINVNKMIRATYKNVHKKKGMVFGVSPAGNVENCLADGVDVKTWLKKKGYTDYVAPQIYWTDNWGYSGKTKMFTNRLKQWRKMKKNKKVKLYIGLALYNAKGSYSATGDRGWKKRNTNIRNQVKQLRKKKCDGYILFEGNNVYAIKGKSSMRKASKELKYLKEYLKKTKTI